MSFWSWLTRRPIELDEDDFKEEVRAHLAIDVEEKVADGLDRGDARYAALKEFGNVTLTTEAARRVWTPRWLDALRDVTSDVRYAFRALAKNPVFSLTVVGVLTLGIGLNAAVFTMLKGMALTPLAGVDRSASLRVIYRQTETGRVVRVSYQDYRYLRDHNQAFSGLMGSGYLETNLGRGRGARQVSTELVTGNYFQVLGVGAQRGRTLLPSDEVAPGRHPVVVISDSLWRSDFASDPDIVGKTRSEQLPADGRRRRRAGLSRHYRQLRHRAVRAGHDGAADWRQQSRRAVVQRVDRPALRAPVSAGAPASGHQPRRGGGAGGSDVDRAVGGSAD
jgi:hypothetical protein